jgi:beta-carotene hydroxylase
MSEKLPALECLGDDLLVIPGWRRALSLALPFLIAVGFFVLWASGSRIGPIVCAGLVTFFTYGSISHDLVHGSLRLPRTLNDVLLCGVELITLRSGHAYRVTHLHHHARFPAGDDLEGAAAGILDHFYHLEHHLYPHVPHHRWPELARRLDPYFARAGLRPVRIWF